MTEKLTDYQIADRLEKLKNRMSVHDKTLETVEYLIAYLRSPLGAWTGVNYFNAMTYANRLWKELQRS